MLDTLVCAIDILLWAPAFWFVFLGLAGFAAYAIAMKLGHGPGFSVTSELLEEGLDLGDGDRPPGALVALLVLGLAVPVLIWGTDFSRCRASPERQQQTGF
jgi:ABC-type transport system involved in cytochrome c biogenesis permease component